MRFLTPMIMMQGLTVLHEMPWTETIEAALLRSESRNLLFMNTDEVGIFHLCIECSSGFRYCGTCECSDSLVGCMRTKMTSGRSARLLGFNK